MKIKIGDIIIIFAVFLCAFLLFGLNFSDGNTVLVEVDGEVVNMLHLDEDTEFVYNGVYTNVIKIKDGAVFIAESDCPDNTCVHTGEIKSSKKVICCLPNKLIIRVSKHDMSDMDVISG